MSEEEMSHYEMIRAIVKEEVTPIYRNINWVLTIGVLIIGFVVGNQYTIHGQIGKMITEEEISRDYLQKLDYYKVEVDEHESIKEAFAFPSRTIYILDKINSQMRRELGLNLTTDRGGSK